MRSAFLSLFCPNHPFYPMGGSTRAHEQPASGTRQGRMLPPICVTLRMRLVSCREGAATLSMVSADKKFYNPMGTVHGGIITDLADASMGYAVITTLEREETFTTLELKMNFLRPVFEGKLTARAKVLHGGRTIALAELVVRNSEKKVVARGVAT